jgi:hypothetical protein
MANLINGELADSLVYPTLNLTFDSYNMHGFNQGKVLLNYLCEQLHDCVFLQEHWLTPNNMMHLNNFSCDYNFYGKSAIEKTISSGVLKGRSFGGAGILLKKSLCEYVKHEVYNDRFTIVIIGKIILVSIYLPCVKNTNDINIISDILSTIGYTLLKFPSYDVIIGADLNTDLASKKEASLTIIKFMEDFDLCRSDEVYLERKDRLKFTYCHESQPSSSYIDYILVSKRLLSHLKKFDILAEACNMSDHYPLNMCLQISDVSQYELNNTFVNKACGLGANKGKPMQQRLR